MKGRYILCVWNGKYGNQAKFIVQDKSNEKFAEFEPARPSDIAWVDDDLTKLDEYKDWQSFENEPVDSLDDIVF